MTLLCKFILGKCVVCALTLKGMVYNTQKGLKMKRIALDKGEDICFSDREKRVSSGYSTRISRLVNFFTQIGGSGTADERAHARDTMFRDVCLSFNCALGQF